MAHLVSNSEVHKNTIHMYNKRRITHIKYIRAIHNIKYIKENELKFRWEEIEEAAEKFVRRPPAHQRIALCLIYLKKKK